MSDEALELRVKTLEDKVSHIKFTTQTRVKVNSLMVCNDARADTIFI